jgi:lysylphosphatidylglycerol synthetase-like protein (DUF2156 family)
MLATVAEGNRIIEHPNRDKPESRATRALVIALLLISAAVLAVATVGGWERTQGAKSIQIAYILIYLVLAFFVARWRSGLLPVAASFAVILLIFCAISGPQWFDRDHAGFDDPLLGASIVGVLTLVLVPLQLLLMAAAARGFSQKWSVEVERQAGGPQPYVAHAR